MMHPLRQDFIKTYKEFNKDKTYFKKNNVEDEEINEIDGLNKFLENEKEEIDISDAQSIFFFI